ncbi:MAG: Crp/Fnr family transcriptional regulator [Lentisphaerae bacterium]|jgi:CRP/FNR family transcriptional regulator, dissimilatory nitrate respiration regulator|nr:Crp/Fnr family transcriptional regulator [Lentisphaerota bacterium]MBT4821655.1 Crp/Fnr family transcriptional regulator [Lentisphaerota bacterium]MBT5612901.1 Crp/Fnr family transcriptional regulator [Lentisphaerota bacterium]MBT7060953.1 Crp/Fnr family transcriptional regulator [Lentisphaerota bacterium]MBT7846978.1 Crp/Fnr family transcriptional regulator [Lentisphaerota bacterium]
MRTLRLHPVEKVACLERCSLFSGLDATTLRELAGVASAEEYERGELLFTQGEAAEGLFIVGKGKVKIYRLSDDGREQVIHVLTPGQPCAEVPVFEGTRYPAHACALVKTTVLCFTRRTFLDEARRKPEILLNMLAALSRRLRHMVKLVDDLSLKDVGARVAGYLLEHASGNCVRLEEPKKILAGRLGTSPETLSRTLGQFQADQLVTVDGKVIHLLDSLGLQALADGQQ